MMMSTLRIFDFALRRERLNKFPSLLVWRKIPSSEEPKAWRSSREKNIPKRVGASTQPCLTPFEMGKESDDEPLY